MNTSEPQSTIAWIRDATHGTAVVGGLPIGKRVPRWQIERERFVILRRKS
jgi:hypothetical protein